jgi:hypothetical protein
MMVEQTSAWRAETPDDRWRPVVSRLLRWARATDPEVLRLFYRAGDERPTCPICGDADRPRGYLGVYLPDPSLRRAVLARGMDLLLNLPADPAEAWFIVCARCAGRLSPADREALSERLGRLVRGTLDRN